MVPDEVAVWRQPENMVNDTETPPPNVHSILSPRPPPYPTQVRTPGAQRYHSTVPHARSPAPITENHPAHPGNCHWQPHTQPFHQTYVMPPLHSHHIPDGDDDGAHRQGDVHPTQHMGATRSPMPIPNLVNPDGSSNTEYPHTASVSAILRDNQRNRSRQKSAYHSYQTNNTPPRQSNPTIAPKSTQVSQHNTDSPDIARSINLDLLPDYEGDGPSEHPLQVPCVDEDFVRQSNLQNNNAQCHLQSSSSTPSSPDLRRTRVAHPTTRRGRGRPRGSRTVRRRSTQSSAPRIGNATSASELHEEEGEEERDIDLPVPLSPSLHEETEDTTEHVQSEGTSGTRHRGAGYTADEALFVAKCWREQSKTGPNQREPALYHGVSTLCAEKYGVHRSADSIRSFWSELARKTQIYLSCARAMEHRRPTGVNDEMMERLIMDQYRRREGKKDRQGKVRLAAPFKYTSAARYLETEPKFGDQATRAVYDSRDGAHGQTTSDGVSGDEDRVWGVKKRKNQDEMVREVRKSAKAMDSLVLEVKESNSLFRESTAACERAAKDMMSIKLLQVLPPESDEYKTILAQVMASREQDASDQQLNVSRVNADDRGTSPPREVRGTDPSTSGHSAHR